MDLGRLPLGPWSPRCHRCRASLPGACVPKPLPPLPQGLGHLGRSSDRERSCHPAPFPARDPGHHPARNRAPEKTTPCPCPDFPPVMMSASAPRVPPSPVKVHDRRHDSQTLTSCVAAPPKQYRLPVTASATRHRRRQPQIVPHHRPVQDFVVLTANHCVAGPAASGAQPHSRPRLSHYHPQDARQTLLSVLRR